MSCYPANCSLSFLFIPDRSGIRCGSSAAVAHLLQGSMSFAFRDTLLYTSVVTSGIRVIVSARVIVAFLSASNQFGHSPLTSGINKGVFAPHNWLV